MVVASKKSHDSITSSKGLKAWEYLPTIDSPASWEAFVIYRDLGVTRSIDKAAKILNKRTVLISDWCAKNDWVERCRLYDLFRDEERRKADIKLDVRDHVGKLKKFRETHERLGWQNLALAENCLAIAGKAIEHLMDSPEKIEQMKPLDIKNLVNAAQGSAEIGSKLLADSLAIAKLLEQLPSDITEDALDIDAEEVEEDY